MNKITKTLVVTGIMAAVAGGFTFAKESLASVDVDKSVSISLLDGLFTLVIDDDDVIGKRPVPYSAPEEKTSAKASAYTKKPVAKKTAPKDEKLEPPAKPEEKTETKKTSDKKTTTVKSGTTTTTTTTTTKTTTVKDDREPGKKHEKTASGKKSSKNDDDDDDDYHRPEWKRGDDNGRNGGRGRRF